MAGLNVSDVVDVQVNISPIAVPLRNFGALCIAGNSPVIDVGERLREYTTLDGVAQDFGSTAPEYLAADLFFSQSPQPSLCYIGRFAQTATNAVLHGAIMSPAQQAQLLTTLIGVTNGTFEITIDGSARTVAATAAALTSGAFAVPTQATLLTTLQAITNGSFQITVDGTVHNVTPIDFSTITNLTQAASLIDTAMSPYANARWDTTLGIFELSSATTGTGSSITYATTPTSGTDISATLQLTSATGAQPPRSGTAGMNFSQVTNLNGAASIITQALNGGSCVWDGQRFNISTASSGVTSTISYASNAGTGTDVSVMFGLTQGSGASAPVNGIAAETALACAIALRAHPEWYGLMFAATLADSDITAVAGFIEGANPISIYGYTTQVTAVMDPTVSTDIASVLKGLGYRRTFGQFSSSSPYACASLFGRAFTVDFEASNTMITLKFKQEPGVTAEQLTETEASTLNRKNINVFVYYSNDTAIIQQGVMCNGFYFDEIHGTDWLANRIQTDVFNVLYTATTKIPQTNPGVHILVATVTNSLNQGVVNGLIAAGQWNAPGFGQLSTGQQLPSGYYVWAPLVESQPQAIREQRIAPTIQAAIKLAGAIHFSDVIINVNR